MAAITMRVEVALGEVVVMVLAHVGRVVGVERRNGQIEHPPGAVSREGVTVLARVGRVVSVIWGGRDVQHAPGAGRRGVAALL